MFTLTNAVNGVIIHVVAAHVSSVSSYQGSTYVDVGCGTFRVAESADTVLARLDNASRIKVEVS